MSKKIHVYPNLFATVDDDDFDMVSKYTWHSIRKRKGGRTVYAQTTVRTGKNRKSFYMHSLLIKRTDGMVTDHIDRNGLNNTRKNLRIVDYSESNKNRDMPKHYKPRSTKTADKNDTRSEAR